VLAGAGVLTDPAMTDQGGWALGYEVGAYGDGFASDGSRIVAEGSMSLEWVFSTPTPGATLDLAYYPNQAVSLGAMTLLDRTAGQVVDSWTMPPDGASVRRYELALVPDHQYYLSASLLASSGGQYGSGDPQGTLWLSSNTAVVPEPSSLWLVGTAIALLAARGRLPSGRGRRTTSCPRGRPRV